MASNDPYTPPDSMLDTLPESQPPTMANISLLLVIAPFTALAILTQVSRGNGTGAESHPLLSAICALGIIAGFITAITALITRQGKKGVILRAGCALLLSGGLVGLAVPSFLRARDRSLAQKTEEQRALEILKREGEASQAAPAESRPEMSQAIGNAADKMTGKWATATRAAADYSAAVEALWRTRETALQATRSAGPFIPGKAMTKEALAQRRVLLAGFIDASERFLELLQGAELHLNRELRGKLPDAEVRDFARGFVVGRNKRPSHTNAVKLRELDIKGSKAMLEIVNILDRELGSWGPNADGSWVVAKKIGLQGKLDALLKEVVETSELQRKLAPPGAAQSTARR